MASRVSGRVLVALSCALLAVSGELAWIIVLLPLAVLAGYVVAEHNESQPTAGDQNG